MKASLKHDIAVQVRHQEWEEEADLAPFYRGIYSVSLNYFTTVMFIPSFVRTTDNWPPTLPENIDDLDSVDEARRFMAALSDYTITPDAALAGQHELIPLSPSLPQLGPRMGLVFYVTHEEFAHLARELAQMTERTPSVRDYVPFSDVSHFASIKFIANHLIRSSSLDRGTAPDATSAQYIRCLVPSD